MRKVSTLLSCFALAACAFNRGPSGGFSPTPVETSSAEVISATAVQTELRASTAIKSKHMLLLSACLNPPEPSRPGLHTFLSPLLVPLIMAIFNVATGEIERQLEQREKERLENLSRTFTARALTVEFPLQASGDQISCVLASDRDPNGNVAAEYALRLKRVAPTAFVIEPVGGWVQYTGIGALENPAQINADVAVAITSITRSDGVLPNSVTYPAYGVSFKDLTLGSEKPYVAAKDDPGASIVLALPQDKDSPTTITISVTESDIGLSREQERIALLQKTRQALLGALGEVLKGQLGG